ncbi:hypothetical protein PMZ80_010416 [Knufia obscura]|uniref:Phenylalanine ammonia-lyase n=1 Tax=Knufia obscura TaxID=1635080 RepID=A0ABR0R9W1_9EURO|nr:hypothetical protein PMZ80_010416 [Knufia obscura]
MLFTPPQTRDHSPRKPEGTTVSSTCSYAQYALAAWKKLHRRRNGSICLLDGDFLDIPDVVAVAKYSAQVAFSEDPKISQRINKSVETLQKHLDGGHLVYGVTTGFGGSASTRTTDLESLQRALVQHQGSGVLSSKDIGRPQQTAVLHSVSDVDHDMDFDTQSQPTAWVRAAMMARCNSIIRGHSAVRQDVAETILALLQRNITPIVPLRGSISASGDLSPLSYIAGTIEGNPDIFVRVGKGTSNIMTARQALEQAGIQPVTLHAKEGLGLLNGTAFSAGTAALALSQAQDLTILSQFLLAWVLRQ